MRLCSSRCDRVQGGGLLLTFLGLVSRGFGLSIGLFGRTTELVACRLDDEGSLPSRELDCKCMLALAEPGGS